MNNQQKNIEKIHSEKELLQKSVGFIEHTFISSDIFLYLIAESISLRVVMCRDMTEKDRKQNMNSLGY